MNDKETIRRQVLDLRRNIEPTIRKQANIKITATLLAREDVQNAHVICIYESLPTEVDTHPIIDALKKLNKTIILPPKRPFIENKKEIDIYIVPGVAFDQYGNRLGRGEGYYDRLLSQVQVPKIGLGFDCQVVSRLEAQRYDIPMDTVITEKETYGQAS